MSDHRVFGRLIAPGALYGAMAASALLAEGSTSVVMEDIQLHNPLVFSESDADDEAGERGRTVQVLLDDTDRQSSRSVQIFSKGDDGSWTTHVEGRVLPGAALPNVGERVDLESLKARLSPSDVRDYYRAKGETGINLGPSFRTLGMPGLRPARPWLRSYSQSPLAETSWKYIPLFWTAASRSLAWHGT